MIARQEPALRHLRLAQGLTQVELANRTGLRPATISALETGKTAPRPQTIRLLATALGLQPETILYSCTGGAHP